MKKFTVTVVLCAKNEAETIGEIIEKVKPFADEILIIDGHSSDRTRDIADGLGARVFLDHRRGKGDAVRLAIAEATSDILVFIDADGSHDPADIPVLLRPIVEKSYDLVIASRGKGGSDELHGEFDNMMRLFFGSIITLIINYRWNIRLTESQNGFRAIKTTVARSLNLKENIFTIEQEMIMKALKSGCRITEIPSHEYSRRHGQSGIKIWRMGWRYAWCVFKNLF